MVREHGMAVSVSFVGSGDSFGSGGRFNTCILVDTPGIRFCIDFGASSLIALERLGGRVDAVQKGEHGGLPLDCVVNQATRLHGRRKRT
jgi:hypothetical protein